MADFHLKVGDEAPDFSLPGIGDKMIRLRDYRNDKNVILSFHPLAWTGVCAAQMQDLQDNIQTLIDKNTVALGISVDSLPTKKAWAESLGITQVEFLSDFEPKGEVAKKYGVFIDEKGFGGRAVFVVDKKGIIIFEKIYPLKEKPDLTEILPVIQS
jgi:peroxiredoxin